MGGVDRDVARSSRVGQVRADVVAAWVGLCCSLASCTAHDTDGGTTPTIASTSPPPATAEVECQPLESTDVELVLAPLFAVDGLPITASVKATGSIELEYRQAGGTWLPVSEVSPGQQAIEVAAAPGDDVVIEFRRVCGPGSYSEPSVERTVPLLDSLELADESMLAAELWKAVPVDDSEPCAVGVGNADSEGEGGDITGPRTIAASAGYVAIADEARRGYVLIERSSGECVRVELPDGHIPIDVVAHPGRDSFVGFTFRLMENADSWMSTAFELDPVGGTARQLAEQVLARTTPINPRLVVDSWSDAPVVYAVVDAGWRPVFDLTSGKYLLDQPAPGGGVFVANLATGLVLQQDGMELIVPLGVVDGFAAEVVAVDGAVWILYESGSGASVGRIDLDTGIVSWTPVLSAGAPVLDRRLTAIDGKTALVAGLTDSGTLDIYQLSAQ